MSMWQKTLLFLLPALFPLQTYAHEMGQGSLAPLGMFPTLTLFLLSGATLFALFILIRCNGRRASAPLGALFALCLMGSLSFGVLLHTLIPHEHSNGEVWQSLHSSLSHEEKKLALPVSSVWTLLSTITLLVLFGSVPLRRSAHIPLTYERWVRRGIAPYRRFR